MLWINRSPIVADLTKSWFKQREKKNWYLQFWEFSKPQINFVTQLLSSSFFLSRSIRTRTIDGKFFTTRVWNVVSPRINFGCEWWRENIQKNCIDGRYVIAVWFEGVAWNECVSCPSEDTLPTFTSSKSDSSTIDFYSFEYTDIREGELAWHYFAFSDNCYLSGR